MTRPISYNPFKKIKERIKEEAGKLGDATKRWKEAKGTRVEPRALEGADFTALPKGNEEFQLLFAGKETETQGKNFEQIPAGLLVNKKIKESMDSLSVEQIALLDFVDKAAEMSGMEMEVSEINPIGGGGQVVHARLKQGESFHHKLETRFEERKALPPLTAEFITFSQMFGKKDKDKQAGITGGRNRKNGERNQV